MNDDKTADDRPRSTTEDSAAAWPSDQMPQEWDGESWPQDDEEQASSQKGLLGRLWDAAFAGDDTDEAENADDNAAQDKPGMGNLRRMRVDDVATPKAEIVAAPINVGIDELVEMFRENGFSRIPVFRGTLDSPLGLVHLKDLALKHGFGGSSEGFALRQMLRPLLYVPPSMPIGVLLQQMQSQRTHMALVIDEYGGVDGLVTIEDLIEQVIGEIEDEHDETEDAYFHREAEGQWLFQAKTPLDEVEAETGLDLALDNEDDEIDTLGGFIFMLSGRVPLRGEVIGHESGIEFEVVDADPRRIKRVRLRAARPTSASAETSPA